MVDEQNTSSLNFDKLVFKNPNQGWIVWTKLCWNVYKYFS